MHWRPGWQPLLLLLCGSLQSNAASAYSIQQTLHQKSSHLALIRHFSKWQRQTSRPKRLAISSRKGESTHVGTSKFDLLANYRGNFHGSLLEAKSALSPVLALNTERIRSNFVLHCNFASCIRGNSTNTKTRGFSNIAILGWAETICSDNSVAVDYISQPFDVAIELGTDYDQK